MKKTPQKVMGLNLAGSGLSVSGWGNLLLYRAAGAALKFRRDGECVLPAGAAYGLGPFGTTEESQWPTRPRALKHMRRFSPASRNASRVRRSGPPLAVNQELVLLYWGIGKEILARQQEEGWGKNIIPRLAKDLRHSSRICRVCPPEISDT